MNFFFSIFQSIYIIFMFNYFKTETYLSHPFDVYTRNVSFLNHSEKENHICPLGNLVGYILPLWLLGRHLPIKNKLMINKVIMNIILFGSLCGNMNAFSYFLPLYLSDLLI